MKIARFGTYWHGRFGEECAIQLIALRRPETGDHFHDPGYAILRKTLALFAADAGH
jgi:hypothetical protein